MKKHFLFGSMFITGNAVAHVSGSAHAQHANEHLLLAVLLIPAVWLFVRKLSGK